MVHQVTCLLSVRPQNTGKHWAFNIQHNDLAVTLSKLEGLKQLDIGGGVRVLPAATLQVKRLHRGILISHRALMSRLTDGALTVAAFVPGLNVAALCYEYLRPHSRRCEARARSPPPG